MSTTRAGFVALIGEPNAGKSTLLNRMVGAKGQIVTHKVQTTRARIRGVAMDGAAQIVFVDTPGLFKPRRRLDRAMVAAAWGGAADADVVVLMIEAHRGLTEGVRAILPRLTEIGRAALSRSPSTRSTGSRPRRCWRCVQDMNERFPFVQTFMISAEKGHGCDDLKTWLAGSDARGPVALPRGPDRRPADADDRGRDHAREADPAPASGTALRADRRDRELGGARGRLGRGSTRSSMSPATATRASCWARAARQSRPWARPRGSSSRNSWAARSICS
jgi:small GTP-binding protein